ncbi:hypothetical protein JCM33374_g3719 [Metschnikowia sp. JCM 33374]|nr:hypothetical protein JCM33374_g3719 [Metschnikowia sp. JCM 33374]
MPYKPPSADPSSQKKPESRTRRSYSCGPCKRYKTRCNLEAPCQSCISAKREHECLLNPPNPPSEAEKSRIEKRRNKTSQRKRSGDTGKKTVSPSNHRRNSSDYAISTSPFHRSGSISGMDLFYPVAPDIITTPHIRATHLKDFDFIKQSYKEWLHDTIVIPLPEFLRCKELARLLSYERLLKYFSRFANWDSDGFQYLIDAQGCFSVATNFVVKVGLSPDDLESRTFNSLSLRGLSLVFVVIAIGRLLEGDSHMAQRCLVLSEDLMALLGPPVTLGDFIHLGIFVLLNKVPSVLLSNPRRLVNMFEDFTKKMSGSDEVLRYLSMTDPKEREGNEEFIAFARVWVLARFAEPEVSVLGAEGSLQLSVIESKKSISPDPVLSKQLFDTKLDVLAPDWYLFDLVIYLSSRHFPRFEVVSDVRQLIHAYLTSYSEIGMAIAPLTGRMYLDLQENTTTLAGVIKYNDDILLSILVNFFATRWLRLTKVEKPYFPSLRFAHYVSSLMSTFNWIEELDYRLFDGNGSIYAQVLGRSKNFTFLQMYLQLTHQAIFLVVFAQFRSPSSHLLTIDLNYIFRCVYASMSTVLQKVRRLEPFCLIPAVANILTVVEALEEFALSTPILADDASELIEALQTYVEPSVWDDMVLMSFGSSYTCDSYIEQLWQLAQDVQSNGTEEIFITKNIKLDTDFFRNYETSFEPFRFTTELAEQYIHDVVDPAMDLQHETETSDNAT